MSIPAQTIVSRMASALDAEGSDYYTFDQDYKHAINYSIGWLVSAFNQAFAENKLSPESLRELTKTKVWQANQYSRVAFDSAAVGHDFWTLLAVFPDPVVNQNTGVLPLADKNKSVLKPDISYVSGQSATRLTLEKWGKADDNVFVSGNSLLSGSLKEYGYLDFGDYSSTSYSNPGLFEISIKPAIPGKLVAIAYVKQPTAVTTINDDIEFPESLTNLIVSAGLKWISAKQGDGSTIYTISDKDVMMLVGLMR